MFQLLLELADNGIEQIIRIERLQVLNGRDCSQTGVGTMHVRHRDGAIERDDG